jgi:hypothetical protein
VDAPFDYRCTVLHMVREQNAEAASMRRTWTDWVDLRVNGIRPESLKRSERLEQERPRA